MRIAKSKTSKQIRVLNFMQFIWFLLISRTTLSEDPGEKILFFEPQYWCSSSKIYTEYDNEIISPCIFADSFWKNINSCMHFLSFTDTGNWNSSHDDVIKWRHFPRYWPFVRGIHRSPVMFDVFFDLRLNKRLSKQWWGWWFETLSPPLWRHRNAHD